MPLHQPAVNQLRGNDLGWAAEEVLGKAEMLGVREVGYKSRLEDGGALNSRKSVVRRGKRTGEVAVSSQPPSQQHRNNKLFLLLLITATRINRHCSSSIKAN